jgi:hypothetical protein
MDPNLTIKEFISKHGDIPEHFFLSRYKKPFLVVSMPIGKGVFEESPARGVVKNEESKSPADTKEGQHLTVTIIIPLEGSDPKEPGTCFSIGRGSNNDIVLFHPFVSSRHVRIEEDVDTGEYRLMDLGSSYGTELNGKAVESQKPYPVSDGSTLLLGGAVFCTFMAPSSFYLFMKQRCG